jgi:hypothetical protein
MTIMRITTKDRVYQVGLPMPVPEGCAEEPFLIQKIEWAEEEGQIQFVCVPNQGAVEEVPERTDQMTDEQWQQVVAYYNNAITAVQNDLVLIATISDEGARVEIILNRQEYEGAMQQQLEEDEAEEGEEQQETAPGHAEQVSNTEPAPTAPQPPPAPQPEKKPLPSILSVSSEE